MSKQIPLTQGQFAIVDDEDYDWLNQWKWSAQKVKVGYYAMRGTSRILMHRLILGLTKGDKKEGDHINHDGLDNREYNLRTCTSGQNSQNQKLGRGGTSKYKGVHWNKKDKKWHAQIGCNGKQIHIGYYKSEIKAAKAYNKKAKELFGEFAYVNF